MSTASELLPYRHAHDHRLLTRDILGYPSFMVISLACQLDDSCPFAAQELLARHFIGLWASLFSRSRICCCSFSTTLVHLGIIPSVCWKVLPEGVNSGAAWPAGVPGHCWECCWLNTLICSVSHRIAKSNTEGKDHVTSQIHILRQNRLYRKVYDGPWILGPRLLGGAAGG